MIEFELNINLKNGSKKKIRTTCISDVFYYPNGELFGEGYLAEYSDSGRFKTKTPLSEVESIQITNSKKVLVEDVMLKIAKELALT